MWWLNMEVTSRPVRVIPHCQLGCNSLTSNQFQLGGVDSDTHGLRPRMARLAS